MKLSHSKYRNTGILWELLVRQTTEDVLSNNDPKIVTGIIKKYFQGTELAKEHKIYQSLINKSGVPGNKANMLLETVQDLHKKLNKNTLRREKYNLIKEIKENYNIDNFFKAKIQNYKIYASIYNLLETNTSSDFSSPDSIVANKMTLLEYVRRNAKEEKDELLEEYIHTDPGTRVMIYKILVDKFNTKYDDLNSGQKSVLKEYISNISNTEALKTYVNKSLKTVKSQLVEQYKKISDPATKIKLSEVLKLIKPIDKVNDNDILNLLQYHELLSEVKSI